MPRINIENEWWMDPRRQLLGRLVGGSVTLADGVMISVWHLAQRFWLEEKKLIPLMFWEAIEHSDAVIKSGLAEVRPDGIYVRGTESKQEALRVKIDKLAQVRSQGGQARAKQIKSTKSAVHSTVHSTVQRGVMEGVSPAAGQQKAATSYSYSNSYSFSDSKKKEEPAFANANDTNPDSVQPNLSGKFIAAYVAAYSKRYGQGTRPFLDGKTLGGIKRYLGSVAIERACELISAYCQMNDSWFVTKAHDFETFAQNQNKIALALDTGRMTTSQEAKGEERLDYLQQQLIRIQNGLQS